GTLQFQIIGLKGGHRWLDTNSSPLRDSTGKITALVGIARDITESKRTTEALRESNEKFHQLADNINDVFWIRSADMKKIHYISPGYMRIWGRPPEIDHPNSRNWLSYVVPEDRERVENVFAALTGESSNTEVDYRIVRPDGEIRWIRSRGFQVRDPEGKLFRLAGIVTDITERKLVEEAMRENEERFSGAFEYAPIGVALVSPEGRWLKVNRAICDLFGYSEAELLETSFQAISYPEDLEADLDSMQRLLRGEIPSDQIEKRYIHKNGQLVSTLLNVSLVRDAAGEAKYFISQIQDLTGRKELEDLLRQSQKMEAVGVLAGGIAHDFNNLLTAINGYSDLTLKKMPAYDPLRHNIQEVKNAGMRAAELTGQLLAFSRKQVLRAIVINLNTVVSNIENMLRRIIKENVELRVILDPELGNVKADPGQLEQVIMNLAVNARDAMPDGGTLTIQTQNVLLDETYVRQHVAVKPGRFVKMTVTDTGHGMDEVTRARSFEPFFTTKEVGKGTGLGLSTVHGIIKQSGGDILVYSEPGHGTTFKIYLPCVNEMVHKVKWIGDQKKTYKGTETILLVEDEDIVRKFVRDILKENGYTVLEAASGSEALATCERNDGIIHLLFTDVIMPKMGGSELKDKIVKIRPDIKVLFMSGYTDDSIAHRGMLDAKTQFIEKPFAPDALELKIREVLDSD
ncbi:MAG: PAS domain S-box protein, partial [Acidobacteriota bacterium]